MALYPNGRKFQVYTQRAIGGHAMAFTPYFMNRGDRMCRYSGETWSKGAGGLPSTAKAGVAWLLPLTADGSMTITSTLVATGTLVATAIVPQTVLTSVAMVANGGLVPTLTGLGSMSVDFTTFEPLSAVGLATAVYKYNIEGSMTYEKVIRDMRAVLLGKTSGAGTNTETFYGADGTTQRVISQNDGQNRTSVATPAA